MKNNDPADSSSDDSDDEVDQHQALNRQKRSTAWCGVNTQGQSTSNYRNNLTKISWPPSSASGGSYSWRNVRPVQSVTTMFGTKMQLFSSTSYFLAVYADGAIRGTQDNNDIHTHLELISAGFAGHVRIQGILTKLCVAMDVRGRLYGEPDMMDESTVFIEELQGSYNTYLSRRFAHLGWYLGIKKSGKFKNGRKTGYGQKAIKFLPVRNKFY